MKLFIPRSLGLLFVSLFSHSTFAITCLDCRYFFQPMSQKEIDLLKNYGNSFYIPLNNKNALTDYLEYEAQQICSTRNTDSIEHYESPIDFLYAHPDQKLALINRSDMTQSLTGALEQHESSEVFAYVNGLLDQERSQQGRTLDYERTLYFCHPNGKNAWLNISLLSMQDKKEDPLSYPSFYVRVIIKKYDKEDIFVGLFDVSKTVKELMNHSGSLIFSQKQISIILTEVTQNLINVNPDAISSFTEEILLGLFRNPYNSKYTSSSQLGFFSNLWNLVLTKTGIILPTAGVLGATYLWLRKPKTVKSVDTHQDNSPPSSPRTQRSTSRKRSSQHAPFLGVGVGAGSVSTVVPIGLSEKGRLQEPNLQLLDTKPDENPCSPTYIARIRIEVNREFIAFIIQDLLKRLQELSEASPSAYHALERSFMQRLIELRETLARQSTDPIIEENIKLNAIALMNTYKELYKMVRALSLINHLVLVERSEETAELAPLISLLRSERWAQQLDIIFELASQEKEEEIRAILARHESPNLFPSFSRALQGYDESGNMITITYEVVMKVDITSHYHKEEKRYVKTEPYLNTIRDYMLRLRGAFREHFN